jgi:threonine synthase
LLPGFATAAYEMVEQTGRGPAMVIAPAGQGSLLLGLGRGFKNLLRAGVIRELPRLVGVQALACAPIWAVFTMGAAGLQWVTEGETAAEGVRVRYPFWGDPLIQIVAESGGILAAVDEPAILAGREELARRGMYVEPTSAIIWDAIRQVVEAGFKPGPDSPLVAVLTGSGLKSSR